MRVLLEIFVLVAAIGVILAIGRGFPTFGKMLGAILLHPIGWIGMIGIALSIFALRRRRAGNRGDRRAR